ncbi:outer membrane lipoprotein chaperone LolA [Vitreoscilla stercoraria]|uniref:Outer-membrane lipoprotein carrier protein n=1 Tax=Vitreoscilla stercoraria TaxID=61 RepID=A0ABY4EE69_VITST|nr:outer membrane lipoprotein chaperone LolA [Vitreoscilla stercoraria]UOO93514.1 outer membrane lipoprotein chaperone LolA [Vitreoscilla stercoraria]
MKFNALKLVALTTVFGLSLSAHASGIEALQKFNQDSNGLSGSFTQTVTSKKKTQTSSGTFKILRPGYFRWNYTKPYQQVIVGDSKTVWLYDPELKQVTKKSQAEALGDSPAAILSDRNALGSSYTLKEDGSQNGVNWVKATPKSSNAGYQYIRLGFKNNQLNGMQLRDSFGNNTNITFASLNNNPNVSATDFKFTPPKGVDVLSN